MASDKKKATPKKKAETPAFDPAEMKEMLEALKALKQLGLLPEQEGEEEVEETEPAKQEKVEEPAKAEPAKEETVKAEPAQEKVPEKMGIEVPSFSAGFFIGRHREGGHLYTLALGEVDLVMLAGMVDYAVRFKDKLWDSYVPTKK